MDCYKEPDELTTKQFVISSTKHLHENQTQKQLVVAKQSTDLRIMLLQMLAS